jgi:hypothetical protein
MTKHPVDQNKNQNGAEASATKFFCAVSGNERPEPILHNE